MSDFIWITKLRIKSDVFFCMLVSPKNRVGICVCLECKLLQLQSILCKRLNFRHKCCEVFGSHVGL